MDVHIADSLLCGGDLYIGNRGKGDLTISNGGIVESRYAYVAAEPASSGSVRVTGFGNSSVSTLFLFDIPGLGCTGAGLFIGCTHSSNTGGTALVNVEALLKVSNYDDATPGVKVGLSGTLTGYGTLELTGATTTSMSRTASILGTLAPAGELTIEGNLSLSPETNTANTICHVTPQAWDRLSVRPYRGIGGNATLGGRITVIMTGTFTPGTSFTLLHADSGLGLSQFAFQSIISLSGSCYTPIIAYPTDNDGVKRNVNLVLESCNEEP